jgi:hypothetical protein
MVEGKESNSAYGATKKKDGIFDGIKKIVYI